MYLINEEEIWPVMSSVLRRHVEWYSTADVSVELDVFRVQTDQELLEAVRSVLESLQRS